MQCFHEAKVTLALHLTPSRMENVKAGIDEQLSEYLMEYVEELGGVVVSYSDVELVDANGMIHNERFHVHFRVNARFLVFTPVKGSHMVGVVNKVGIAHIGLLVYGTFNVSIPARAIRGEFNYDGMQESWVNSDNPSHVIAHGTPVRFQVVSGSSTNSFYSITGSLRKGTCGPVSEVGDEAVDDVELDPLDDLQPAVSALNEPMVPVTPKNSAIAAIESTSIKKRKADSESAVKPKSEKKAKTPKA